MRTKDVMWTKWESREHAHTRTTGGDDADAICSALEISSGETTGYDPLVNFTSSSVNLPVRLQTP